MRRIGILLLTVILALTLTAPLGSFAAFAEQDSTMPVVTSVEAASQTARPGDSFTVTIYAMDESGIDCDRSRVSMIWLNEEYEGMRGMDLRLKDQGDGKYEATFYVDERDLNGDYEIYYIEIYDKTGNMIRMMDAPGNDYRELLPDAVLTITGAESDVTGPVITATEMSNQTLRPGDTFTISVTATDGSGVNTKHASALFYRADGDPYRWKSAEFVEMGNKGNDRYDVTFVIPDDWANGEYKVYSMNIYDTKNNSSSISLNGNGKYHDFLPTAALTVIDSSAVPEDETPPTITKVVAKSQKIKVGDRFTVTVYAIDESGISDENPGYVSLELDEESIERHETIGDLEVSWRDADLVLNVDGSLTATFIVTDKWLDGRYYLNQVQVMDSKWNSGGTMRTWEDTPIPDVVYTLGEEEDDPSESLEPSVSPKPSDSPNPSESAKPSESPAPSESPKPSESAKPVDPEFFVDVEEGSWYEDAVNYCASMGYMEGVGNNKFDPDDTVTRGTIAQILYAQSGKPAVDGKSDFKDVKEDKWYSDAVTWAAREGVVAGYTDGTYKPEDPITRQQMVAILYKYAQLNGYDTAANGDLGKFKDVDKLSKYAVTPMKWAVGHGVISGTDVGLEPNATATRAQVAVILQAFDKNIKD